MKKVALGLVFLVSSCEALSSAVAGNGEASALATSSAESVQSAFAEGALLLALTEGSDPQTSPEAAAQNAAAKASTVYTPGECVTAVANKATVTYTLNNCSGPFGLTGLSGPMVGTFSVSDTALLVTLTSTGVNAGGGKLVLNTSGVYTKDGAKKRMTITTETVGVGADEEPITRTGSYSIAWTDTPACMTLDGTWANAGLDATFSSTVANYQVCDGKCPKSGGNVTAAYTKGGSGGAITLQYTGGKQATYVSTSGAGAVTLACTP